MHCLSQVSEESLLTIVTILDPEIMARLSTEIRPVAAMKVAIDEQQRDIDYFKQRFDNFVEDIRTYASGWNDQQKKDFEHLHSEFRNKITERENAMFRYTDL